MRFLPYNCNCWVPFHKTMSSRGHFAYRVSSQNLYLGLWIIYKNQYGSQAVRDSVFLLYLYCIVCALFIIILSILGGYNTIEKPKKVMFRMIY